jgi:hypothetical protein
MQSHGTTHGRPIWTKTDFSTRFSAQRPLSGLPKSEFLLRKHLVLVKRPDYALKHAILWLAAKVSPAHDVLLSPRVIPPAAWQKMTQADTLFYRTVRADGIPASNLSIISSAACINASRRWARDI